MSNVIAMLESIGRDGALRYAAASELTEALNKGDISPAVSEALVVGDRDTLYRLLNVDENICCAVHAPEEFDNEETELE